MIKNRQIKTGFDPKESEYIMLEVLKETKFEGVEKKQGDTIEVSRSVAKKLVTAGKGVFRIKMD